MSGGEQYQMKLHSPSFGASSSRALLASLCLACACHPLFAQGAAGTESEIRLDMPTIVHCYGPQGLVGHRFIVGERLRLRLPLSDDNTYVTARQCAFSHRSVKGGPQAYFKEVTKCAAERGVALDPETMALVPPEAYPKCPAQ